jgi:hypothetical protein
MEIDRQLLVDLMRCAKVISVGAAAGALIPVQPPPT